MPIGKTRDAGWQIGVSITVHRPVAEVWDWLVSPEGLETWLGDGVEFDGIKGEAHETTERTSGELRSFRPLDRIRLTWQPIDWNHDSKVRSPSTTRGTVPASCSIRSVSPTPKSANTSGIIGNRLPPT